MHVTHHQEAHGLHAEFTREFDVLAGNVGFRAMRGDPHDACARVVRGTEIVHGADTGQQQRGDLRVGDDLGDGRDPFRVGMRAETIVEAAALQAVAMRDFDRIDRAASSAVAICRACATLYW